MRGTARVVGSMSAVRVSAGQLTTFLRSRPYLPERDDVAWDNDLYVVGLPEPSHDLAIKASRDTLSATMDMFKIDGAPPIQDPRIGYTRRTHPGLQRLVVYMHRNLLQWIPTLEAYGGLRYDMVFVGEGAPQVRKTKAAREDGLSLADVPKGLGVHCFTTAMFPMVFLRVSNPVAFAYTSQLVRDYGQRTGRHNWASVKPTEGG
jgi:hypothetical protein